MNSRTVALVYDRVNTFGGAEQVLVALKEVFPQAVLYTALHDVKHAEWSKSWDIRTTFLSSIPFVRAHHEWFGWLMQFLFEGFRFEDYDLVISVTSEAAKSIITPAKTTHICYCLTPTRYLWSHTYFYESGPFSWLKQCVFSHLRFRDFVTAQRPDHFIAISETVARRVEKYYRRDVSAVIAPPLPEMNAAPFVEGRKYFLVVSRLVAYKKVEEAIHACGELNEQLIIVGDGRERKKLETIARAYTSVSFTGFVEKQELAQLYAGAIALLCPQEEDFGIVSIESQSFGTPVLCPKKSGMSETIIDGETGLVYTNSLSSAIGAAKGMQWNREKIRANAVRYSRERFITEWKNYLGRK